MMNPDQRELERTTRWMVPVKPGARATAAPPGRPDAPGRNPAADLAWVLFRERWTIALVAGAVLALGIAYLLAAPPVYRANVLLQVEPRKWGIPGVDETRPAFGESLPVETEAEILRSRAVVGAAVDALGLTVTATPRRFPLIGDAVARRHRTGALAAAPPQLSRFAWGGERVEVRRLVVPERLLGEPLTLTALAGGRYQVHGPDGAALLEGRTGVEVSAADSAGGIELLVGALEARPGTQFRLVKRSRAAAIEDLQEKLRVDERRKKSGVLVLSIAGPDPAHLTALLEAVSGAYVAQNAERKSGEAARKLEFVESQLPAARAKLNAAQAALKRFQLGRGTVSMSAETSALLERRVALDRSIEELELQRLEVRRRFTDQHPDLMALNDKIEALRRERGALDVQTRTVPEAEIDWGRLQRDITAANELHSTLLVKAQDLRMMMAGAQNDVRIVDGAAVPAKPESPRPVPVVLAAGLLGLVAGTGVALGRRALAEGAEDPEEIEAQTGVPVHAVIVHSRHQRRGRRGRLGASSILATTRPADVAVENLRSLCSTLEFALLEARNNVISVNGPTEGVGRSFVSANLAHLLASGERRVLLVDADLRRGWLHGALGVAREPGLSTALAEEVTLPAAVQPTDNPHLHVLPTGAIPPNPAELLAGRGFQRALEWASRNYDLVVVDTPPALAVADAMLVARHAGVNLLVLRSGLHPMREIALALKRFEHRGVKVHGAVLNDARLTRGRYGDGRYRQHEYRSLGKFES